MLGRHFRIWSPGIVALGRAFAVCTSLSIPFGSAGQALGQSLAVFQGGPSPDTGSEERAIVLLERLQQEQSRLNEAVRKLEATQLAALEHQARTIRQHQNVITERFAAERDRDRQNLEQLGTMAFTLLLSVAGALLFAMAAMAWSVLRALRRLPAPALLPQVEVGQGSLALPASLDAQLLSLAAELERRWLKFGESGPAIVPTDGLKSVTAPTSVPGDFL